MELKGVQVKQLPDINYIQPMFNILEEIFQILKILRGNKKLKTDYAYLKKRTLKNQKQNEI